MISGNTVQDKADDFALRIIRLYNYLKEHKQEFVLSKQLLRSGTSIGANITEAECAFSKEEFHSKMGIAYKECAESKYWINLLLKAEYITEAQAESLLTDCNELLKLLASINKTVQFQKDIAKQFRNK